MLGFLFTLGGTVESFCNCISTCLFQSPLRSSQSYSGSFIFLLYICCDLMFSVIPKSVQRQKDLQANQQANKQLSCRPTSHPRIQERQHDTAVLCLSDRRFLHIPLSFTFNWCCLWVGRGSHSCLVLSQSCSTAHCAHFPHNTLSISGLLFIAWRGGKSTNKQPAS